MLKGPTNLNQQEQPHSDSKLSNNKTNNTSSGCSAVCLFSLVSNCSPPLLVYCIFLGPRGETVALVRYHRRVLD